MHATAEITAHVAVLRTVAYEAGREAAPPPAWKIQGKLCFSEQVQVVQSSE